VCEAFTIQLLLLVSHHTNTPFNIFPQAVALSAIIKIKWSGPVVLCILDFSACKNEKGEFARQQLWTNKKRASLKKISKLSSLEASNNRTSFLTILQAMWQAYSEGKVRDVRAY